jgi:hypothetical protein
MQARCPAVMLFFQFGKSPVTAPVPCDAADGFLPSNTALVERILALMGQNH